MSINSGFLDVGGCRLHYKTEGKINAPAFVMIHAGVADMTQWEPQCAAFADRYHLIRYDTRGWGQSFTEDVSFSNRDDLLQLLDFLQIDQAIVMGCSRGGQIAIDFALEYPERVSGLIWVCGGISGFEGPPLLPEEEALFQETEKAFEAKDFARLAALNVRVWAVGPSRDPATVDKSLQDWMYAFCLKDYLAHSIDGKPIPLAPPAAGRLSEIKVPTLAILGTCDVSNVRPAAEYLAAGVPGAIKVDIPDTAHIPNREKPEIFNQIVSDFLVQSSL